MKPLLLEDFNPNLKEEPQTVKNLFNFFRQEEITPTKQDILSGLIYIIMLEYGFTPIDCKGNYEDWNFSCQRLLDLSKTLPKNWKKEGIYNFSFILAPFDIYICTVTCIIAPFDFIINCVVRGIDSCKFTVILDYLTYFTSSRTELSANKLQSLDHLSRIIKQEICFPVKIAVLQQNNVRSSCFEDLPQELILKILMYLKVKELVKVGESNSYINTLVKEPKLWKNLLKVDFDVNRNLHGNRSAKEDYILKYKLSKKFRSLIYQNPF